MEKKDIEVIKSTIKGELLLARPLAKETYFKIGGPANIVIPADKDDLKCLIEFLANQELDYRILGNGSNLLVSEQGVSELVIKLNKLNQIEIDGVKIKAAAGVKLPVLARKAMKKSLSGLEFAAGIPASIGGAIIMNAGAYGGDIAQIIKKVETITAKGKEKIYPAQDFDFSYRDSYFKDSDEIIVSAEFALTKANREEIKEKMEEFLAKRKASQPLSLPNAGCIFKNPKDDSAGRLIDVAGGKEMKVGDAMVAKKHANFIVNTGSATASDVLELIEKVKDLVYNDSGVKLEEEINFWGD